MYEHTKAFQIKCSWALGGCQEEIREEKFKNYHRRFREIRAHDCDAQGSKNVNKAVDKLNEMN